MRLRAGIFKVLTEFQNSLRVLAWLPVFEHWRAFVEFTHGTRRWVKAQGQLVCIRTQLCKQEGIATDICRDVHWTVKLPIFVHEGVHAFIHAHEDQRHGIVRRGKNDRIVARCGNEFLNRQRDSMLSIHEFRVFKHTRFPGHVIVAVKRDQVVVQKWQVGGLGCGGHM